VPLPGQDLVLYVDAVDLVEDLRGRVHTSSDFSSVQMPLVSWM
jgi:hypothetical protein